MGAYPYPCGHATHPEWRMALTMALSQLRAQCEQCGAPPTAWTLGWAYITDHYVDAASSLLQALKQQWPGVDWIGSVGVGVAAADVEYLGEPALALMLADWPRSDFRLFSGRQPLGRFDARGIQLHADGTTPDLPDLLEELSQRTHGAYIFGGVTASRRRPLHWAGEVLEGGVSGVAWGPGVRVVSRVTQGCQPLGGSRVVTASEHNLVYTLDHQPALDCLLQDLGLEPEGALRAGDVRRVLPQLRATLVGLNRMGEAAWAWPGQFSTDTWVRQLIGLEPRRRGLAIGDVIEDGMRLTFCQRNAQAARRDLVRICAEIRDEVDGSAGEEAQGASRMLGGVLVSCSGRGGPYFGGASAELQVIRHALGQVPLVGYFAHGEIAHHHLHGFSAVLSVFVQEDRPVSGAS